MATCLGCGGQEPVWKARRNSTFKASTLTFKHGSKDCNGLRIEVLCSDRKSPKCRGSWKEYPSVFYERIKSGGLTSARDVGEQHYRRCGPCSSRRTASRARKRISPENRHPLMPSREHQKFAARQKRPQRATRMVFEGVSQKSFTICPLCWLLLERPRREETWRGRSYHAPCWQVWLAFSGQSSSPKRSGRGRFSTTKHTPRALVHNNHTFMPPPAPETPGRRVDPATLSLGYVALMLVTGGRTPLKTIGGHFVMLEPLGRGYRPIQVSLEGLDIDSTQQNVSEARRQFLRYAPGSWQFIFPSSKGNDARHRAAPLPGSLGDVEHDPRRRELALRLWKMGMELATVGELVGYLPSETELEVARPERSLKSPTVVAKQQAGRLRRLPSPEDRRTSYQERRAAELCVDCRAPALPGRSRCEQHLTESRARMAKHRGSVAYRRCGKEIPEVERQHGRRYHPACFEEKERERRATPRVRARSRRLTREYEDRHRALGLCLKCSTKAAPGRVLCERHGYQKVVAEQRVAESR